MKPGTGQHLDGDDEDAISETHAPPAQKPHPRAKVARRPPEAWMIGHMALPEAPPGEGRELLQAIWDIALQTGQWSTFAELDRRWDASHDSDVHDVLRQLPDGLAFGFAHLQHLRDATPIGLTVAGIAACDKSDEMLAIFFDFLGQATRLQKTWQPPPGDQYAKPSLNDEEFARNATALLAAGREHLLRLLCHLLIAEPCIWGSMNGPDPDGHWTVTFDRRVRTFRNIAHLDDYWARRPKPWEGQPEAQAALPDPETSDSETQTAALLNAGPDILAAALLQWIYSSAEGNITVIVAPAAFQPAIEHTKVENALRRLQTQKYIHLLWVAASPALPHAQLTDSGVTIAESSLQNWKTRALRSRAVHNALLAWLHDQEETLQDSTRIAGFLRDAQSIIGGHFTSSSDLGAAAIYLCDKGLIEGLGYIEQQREPIWAQMKSEGIDCIEQGGNVADYLTPRTNSVTYSFNGPITGTDVTVGDHATQHATTNGLDSEGLRILMQAITEAMPSLDLDAHSQNDAEDATSQVISETRQPQPNHSRLGKAMSKIHGVLASSVKQSLAAVLIALIEYELAKMGLPIGKLPVTQHEPLKGVAASRRLRASIQDYEI